MMDEWNWIGGSAGSVIYFPACKTAPGWRQVLLIETRLSTFQMHFRCLAHVKTGRIGYARLLLRSPLSPRQLSRAICCCGRRTTDEEHRSPHRASLTHANNQAQTPPPPFSASRPCLCLPLALLHLRPAQIAGSQFQCTVQCHCRG